MDDGSESSASIDMETRIAEAHQKLQRLESQQNMARFGHDRPDPAAGTPTTPSSSTGAASTSAAWHNPSGKKEQKVKK